METIVESPEKIVVRIGKNNSLANAIRRSVEEVPVLAVDEVEFFKNDSALYDEFLSHRIGLIPLKTEKKMSSKTEILLKLKKSGPCKVYSSDLSGGAEIVFPRIPITLLEKGQELEVVATARLGRGIEHAKYVPGLCFYRELFEVSSKGEEVVAKSKGFVKEKKGSSWIADLNEAEVEEIEKIDKNAVKESEEILFIIESFGQMKAKDILTGAIDVLNANLSEIEKSLK